LVCFSIACCNVPERCADAAGRVPARASPGVPTGDGGRPGQLEDLGGRHNAASMAVLLVFGVKLLGDAITILF
jgi:hypothetical protein